MGIIEATGIPNALGEVVLQSMGSQFLHYPDGQCLQTTKGILMGLPLTWITLSLLHIYWVDKAQKIYQ
jgi:hypothetical protein